MKKIYSAFATLFVLLLMLGTGCSEKEIFVEGVAGISLEGVEGNLINLIEDDTYETKIKVNPDNAADLSRYEKFDYSSSNMQVFTVNKEGVIAALSPGDAILTVSAKENKSIRLMCIVKVEKRVFPVTSIEAGDLEKGMFVEGMAVSLSQCIKVLPENATNPAITIESSDHEVASFDENDKNILRLLKKGKVTITVKSTDGTQITKNVELTVLDKNADIEFVSMDRANWKITTSHTPVADTGIGGNKPEFLFDNNKNTGLSLYKPGKKEIPKEDKVGFTVELPAPASINAFRLTHRKFGYVRLSPFAIDILGSKDGKNFTIIYEKIPTLYVAGSSDVEVVRLLPLGNTVEYKFIKVVYSDYDESNGDTVQVMEFELGTGTLK